MTDAPVPGMELEVRKANHLTTGRLVNPSEWAILAQIANTVYATEFVPRGLRGNKPATLACLLYGREQGLGPMTALGEISVIDGRPAMSAALMAAKIREAGHRVKVDLMYASTPGQDGPPRVVGATALMWRVDERFEVEHEFTFDENDARSAKLIEKDNWKKYPKAMYQARALAGLARLAASDVFIGSAYTTEELDPEAEVDESGTLQAPIAQDDSTLPVLVGAGAGGQKLDEAGSLDDHAGDPAPPPGAEEEPLASAAPAPPSYPQGGEGAGGSANPPAPGTTWSGTVYDLGDYDTLNVGQIEERLKGIDDDRLLFIEQYESGAIEGVGGAKRRTVLRAIDRILTQRQADAGEWAPPETTEEPSEAPAAPQASSEPVVEGAVEPPAEPDPEPPVAEEAEFSFVAPEDARPKVARTRDAAARAAAADPRWTEASVWSTATNAFKKAAPVTSWGDLTDGELDSIYNAIPAEFKT